MKFSKFSIFEKDYPDINHLAVYNTLTKAVAIIEKNLYESVINNNFENINENHISSLLEQGIVVENDDDETSKLNIYFSKIKSEYPSYSTMILTSYDCNLKCKYCFENNIKSINKNMSAEVTEQTINWLKNEVNQYNPKHFSIIFSGGEPLLNKESIKNISTKMKEYCISKSIQYSFGILTNGTINIDESELNDFYTMGLRIIQFTIDGAREIHDARRILQGGSYDKIINNIKFVDSRINIQTIVRINVDNENINQIDGLLDELKKLNIKNLTIDVAPRIASSCDIYNCNSHVLTDNVLADEIIKINEKITNIGLRHSRRFTSSTPCLGIALRQFVIDPLGDLYKCAGFAGMKDFKVGSIFETKLNKKYTDIVGLDNWHNCKNCEYVPLCGGGCMYINHLEFNNYRKTKCQKTLFNKIVMKSLISTLNKEKIKKQLEASK